MARSFCAKQAVILGDVTLGEDVNVWMNVTIRGDRGSVTIGDRTNVQDNVVIHEGKGFNVVIGSDVSIGHGAIVHGASVGDNSVIGMGAILMNGAKVGKNCIIGAGALIPEGKEIPDGSVAFGQPAKVVRSVTAEEIKKNSVNASNYVEEAKKEL